MNLYDDEIIMPESPERHASIFSKVKVGSYRPLGRRLILEGAIDPSSFNSSFLPKDENEELWKEINKSNPSDTITLSCNDAEALNEYFNKHIAHFSKDNDHYFFSYPADLFFSKTISLQDVEIMATQSCGNIIPFRIVIFDDYKETIDTILSGKEDRCVVVGAVIIEYDKMQLVDIPVEIARYVKQLAYPIVISYDNDNILNPNKVGYIGFNMDVFNELFDDKTVDIVHEEIEYISWALAFWYTIQILLLHPNRETIITESRTPAESKVIGKYAKAKNKKRKVKLIRKLRIHTDHLNDPIIESQGGIERKTLCWYVVGHWRTYKKTGKKIFIQPYWKGPLRETKQNLDLGRDREANLEDLDDDDE